MNEMVEVALRSIGTAIKRDNERHEVIFNLIKAGCEYRMVCGGVGELEVYVCDKITQFGVLCCMRNCPYIKRGQKC